VLHDADSVIARMIRLLEEGTLVAVDGTELRPAVRSICVHSDTPGAVELARGLRGALESAGVGIHPFC